jgi:hypothetical protein
MNYYKLFISEVVNEVSYRTKNGMVDWKNPEHISILSEVLSDKDFDFDIKTTIIRNLLGEAGEDDKKFSNPILNKEVEYEDKDGNKTSGIGKNCSGEITTR